MEARITINETLLTSGQAMTVRVALESLARSLAVEGLGEDLLGEKIARAYGDRIVELHALMYTKEER